MRSQAHSYMDPSSSYVYGFSFGQLFPVRKLFFTLFAELNNVSVGLDGDWRGVDFWGVGDRSLAWLQIHGEGSWKLQLAGIWRRCRWRPHGKDTAPWMSILCQVWRHTCVFIDFLGGRTAFFENGQKLFEKTGVKESWLIAAMITSVGGGL